MAALPVIANTYRCTLRWTNSVLPVANVLHFFAGTGNESNVAAALEANITTGMIDGVASAFDIVGVDIIKLDGSSATQQFTFATPVSGGSSGAWVPQVAALVSLHTLVRGPRGRGRVYLGPMAETAVSDGSLEGAVRTNMQDAWDDFFSAMLVADKSPVVASYVHSEQNAVQTILVKALCATQRRRQDRLR